MKRSTHIEAPVEKVFDFFKDPGKVYGVVPMPFAIEEVKVTDEGAGTYYSWVSRVPGLRMRGFDVYTEVIPNQRITDKSSSSASGDSVISFEAEGSGTQLTIESHPRSLWRIPPLRELLDWVQGTASDRILPAVKARLED